MGTMNESSFDFAQDEAKFLHGESFGVAQDELRRTMKFRYRLKSFQHPARERCSVQGDCFGKNASQ